MPSIDFKLAALFISNIKNIDRFDSADQLARYAGLAPVDIALVNLINQLPKNMVVGTLIMPSIS